MSALWSGQPSRFHWQAQPLRPDPRSVSPCSILVEHGSCTATPRSGVMAPGPRSRSSSRRPLASSRARTRKGGSCAAEPRPPVACGAVGAGELARSFGRARFPAASAELAEPQPSTFTTPRRAGGRTSRAPSRAMCRGQDGPAASTQLALPCDLEPLGREAHCPARNDLEPASSAVVPAGRDATVAERIGPWASPRPRGKIGGRAGPPTTRRRRRRGPFAHVSHP